MSMDKRRGVSKSPNVTKRPISSASNRTGNPLLDGHTVRHSAPMSREPFNRHGVYGDDNLSPGLKSVEDALWDDYHED